MRHSLRALMVVGVLALGAGSSLAQLPVVTNYAVPVQRRPVYVTAPQPTYGVAPARRSARRLYVASPQPMRYAAPPTYSYSTTPAQRYRRSVNAGRDPNWASGRGLRLYKPWEY